ncbi:hypothetical protein F4775DRAFT_553393 [Biscogniauxia sp. FL1348]|nr:hypothetical protein F4775DRAFT_553393 [Biscogniauxia sp. FL1348]
MSHLCLSILRPYASLCMCMRVGVWCSHVHVCVCICVRACVCECARACTMCNSKSPLVESWHLSWRNMPTFSPPSPPPNFDSLWV